MDYIRALEYKKWLNDMLRRGILDYEDICCDIDCRKGFLLFLSTKIGQIWLKKNKYGIAYKQWQES